MNKLWSAGAREALGLALRRGNVVAGTGHRPPRLGLSYDRASRDYLVDFVRPFLAETNADLVISGGAQGFDQALAYAARDLGVPFWVAVPFAGQEARWPAEAQGDYRSLLDEAERVVTVCDGLYANNKFTARDEWMVCAAGRVLTLFDGTPAGGTYITLQFAKSRLKPITNLWDRWAVPV